MNTKQNIYNILAGVSFICFIFLIPRIIALDDKILTIEDNQKKIESKQNLDTLSYQNICKELVLQNVKFPKVVLAQCILESNCKSEYNNLLGMKHTNGRYTTSIGATCTYSTYNTWQDCIKDYKIWQSNYTGAINTELSYLNYLDKNYAKLDNGEYKKRLIQIMQHLK